MSARKAGWSRRYRLALRRHLALGAASSLLAAPTLGRQAAALGLETLDVALIHGQALQSLIRPGRASGTRQTLSARAKAFFAEAIVPIERTHSAARKADVRVGRLTRILRQRTAESATSTRHLARGTARRKAVEEALRKSKNHRTALQRESAHRLQRLRHRMRSLLSVQEGKRLHTSRELRDEVAQGLLAIHIRLLALKKAVRSRTRTVEFEIAETLRLVRQSAKRLHRKTHDLATNHSQQR
jgi:hypothetical protein